MERKLTTPEGGHAFKRKQQFKKLCKNEIDGDIWIDGYRMIEIGNFQKHLSKTKRSYESNTSTSIFIFKLKKTPFVLDWLRPISVSLNKN